MMSRQPTLLLLGGCLALLLFSREASARLTSDFDTSIGPSIYKLVGATTASITVESPLNLDFSYNLNYENWNTAFSLVFSESLHSSQGDIAITRLGAGLKYFLFGFPSQRLIIDSKTEGRFWRTSPFVGFNGGMSNFSVGQADNEGRFFNAVAFDAQIKFGVEVPINPDWTLIGQTVITTSVMSSSVLEKSFTYVSYGMLIGFKLSSY